MSLDGKIDALLANVTPGLRDVLREAYDLGYREALASGAALREASLQARGNGVARLDLEPEPGDPVEQPEATAPTAVTASTGAEDVGSSVQGRTEAAAVDWSGATAEREGGHESDSVAKRGPLLRILPHATVGTLLERILYHFDLGRFDVDVVICRKGDRDRRQLKSSVRLSTYEVEK